MKTEIFKIKNMHCTNCERTIEKKVRALDGVHHVKADYAKGSASVSFEPEKTSAEKIAESINSEGYACVNEKEHPKSSGEKTFGTIFAIIGLFIAGYFAFSFYNKLPAPQIAQNIGYGLLFVLGLLTGFHCIAMCGGFVVGYTAKDAKEGRKSYSSHALYATGKTLSYTFIGAVFGLFGSIIAFTPKIRGIAGITAGLFLIIFGANMLGFNMLRKLRLTTPGFIQKFISSESKEHNGPFVIGLLNGLMIACGPLQAIYILAAGTGSAFEGAKMLFVFGLGTLPVMLGFGFLTSAISKNATHKILKASGFIVILLGAIMLNRGLALAGAGINIPSILPDSSVNSDAEATPSSDGYQTIKMDVTSSGWTPNSFVLKKGVPVKWVINGKELNGCNSAIVVPDYGLNFKIKQGEQTIEFTPTKEGTVSWSCWMGMIKGTFIVKNDINLNDKTAVQKELASAPVQTGGSCGGSCGCGMRR